MQQEFLDLYEAESDLQMIYGDEKTGGATGIAGPPPLMKYTDYKGFARG